MWTRKRPRPRLNRLDQRQDKSEYQEDQTKHGTLPDGSETVKVTDGLPVRDLDFAQLGEVRRFLPNRVVLNRGPLEERHREPDVVDVLGVNHHPVHGPRLPERAAGTRAVAPLAGEDFQTADAGPREEIIFLDKAEDRRRASGADEGR